MMMPDLATVEKHCLTDPSERELLKSRQRPIVLLRRRKESTIALEVAPKQETLGVMLPYTPLHTLLFVPDQNTDPLNSALPPLVMTSGNLSEEPIAIRNEEARERLSSLADAFLMNDRDIHTRCDDSVLRVVPGFGVPKSNEPNGHKTDSQYFLRRSRGYAPDSIPIPFMVPSILATGPELKNTFCLTRDQYAFVSQHIGDMENYETLLSFQEGISQFEHLFRIQPEALAYDLHPNYLASRYALERSERENIPAIPVQHHHAHIASCMADNGLDGLKRVIGVAFDGTGYGDDGAIWGGEFMIADYAGYERITHLAYFPLPGGDTAIKHPARTALSLLWSLGLDWEEDLAPVQGLSLIERETLRAQLERGLNTPKTSSMGRLFDAAASLSGIRQRVNYEAQAAIEFESVINENELGGYEFLVDEAGIDPKPAIQSLLEDVHSGTETSVIAARFHNGVGRLVCQVCEEIKRSSGLIEVVLSGGVWQNMALLEKTKEQLLEQGFTVHIHHQVPTNDGGISLGQALVASTKINR